MWQPVNMMMSTLSTSITTLDDTARTSNLVRHYDPRLVTATMSSEHVETIPDFLTQDVLDTPTSLEVPEIRRL